MTRSLAFLILLLTSFTVVQSYPLRPNSKFTTGHLCDKENSDFREYRYTAKIPYCGRNVATELKNKIYANYGIPKSCRGQFTIDHMIPLSVGGDNSEANLWPEHKLIKQTRLHFEEDIFDDVSSGHVAQATAVELIRKTKIELSVDVVEDLQNQANGQTGPCSVPE